MLMNHKVVILLPAGRRRMLKNTLRALYNADWDIVDDIHIWENTAIKDDLKYIKKLEVFVKKISVVRLDSLASMHIHTAGKINRNMKRFKYFYRKCTDKDTVYIRLDDDMVWMEHGTISSLVEFTLKNEQYISVFPNIVNNVLCDYIHQSMGVYDFDNIEKMSWNPWCKIGWSCGETAKIKHIRLCESISKNNLDKYRFDKKELADKMRMGAGFMAWKSGSFSPFIVGDDDETTITEDLPRLTNRNTCIFGKKIVSHYSYHVQNVPEYLLNEYERINYGHRDSNNRIR